MKNLYKNLPVLMAVALVASLGFTSCKSRKIVAAPAPAPVVEAPAPAPVVESDKDQDGLVDSKDNCPDQAGPASNNGCPVPPEPSFVYQNVLFEYNSAVLKTVSYSTLDEAASQMKKYADKKFNVNGHASAEGSEAHNMSLSVDRANAVKNYLVTAGVNAANLTVNGFGETKPLNANKTEAERSLNRRVEIQKQ